MKKFLAGLAVLILIAVLATTAFFTWLPPSHWAIPLPIEAVVHSPTPSTVTIAACSKGEANIALAACETWCSIKSTFSAGTPISRIKMLLIHSFSSK